ncbi:MAG: DUF2339 domain-containing protein [Rikenellaceae bacterium]|nr:DUF2339 domain-containing protein [Rikenellaceae bacterium]
MLYFLTLLLVGLIVVCIVKLDGLKKNIQILEGKINRLQNFVNTQSEAQPKTDRVVSPLLNTGSENKVTEPDSVFMEKKEETTESGQLAPLLNNMVPDSQTVTEYKEEKKENIESQTGAYNVPNNFPTENPYNRKKSEKRSLSDKLLGANLLSKIGIATFVLGIGFFVKYSIDNGWINEFWRVAVGIFTGLLLIGSGYVLKKNYRIFSSVLTGGGIAALYFTVTIAFRMHGMFSEITAFVILTFITVLSVLLSLYYDRKELAILSLLGGFTAPLMAGTYSSSITGLFSYIFLLNTGMLALSLFKKWRVTAVLAFSCTAVYYLLKLGTDYYGELWPATIFSVLFFIQFYAAAILDHLKDEKKLSPYITSLITLDNFLIYIGFIFILSDYDGQFSGIVPLSLAVLNAGVLFVMNKFGDIDKNLQALLLLLTVAFFTIAIPNHFDGYTITLFWAAELSVLALLWYITDIKAFRISLYVVSASVLTMFTENLVSAYIINDNLVPVFNPAVITGICVTASFAAVYFTFRRKTYYDTPSRITFLAITLVLAFIIPYCEIKNQSVTYLEYNSWTNVITTMLEYQFIAVYLSFLIIIFRKKLQENLPSLIIVFVTTLLFTNGFFESTKTLGDSVFAENIYPDSFFIFHLIGIPFTAFNISMLTKYIYKKNFRQSDIVLWFAAAFSIYIISIETDNIALLLNHELYGNLREIHTFVYPLVWSTIATLLMIWGIRAKIKILRSISLAFFGLIILKFYIYDVWHMSHAGRIIAFIILGGLLTAVSFLQQRIKNFIKTGKDKELTELEDCEQ